jgi:hypothetical protein
MPMPILPKLAKGKPPTPPSSPKKSPPPPKPDEDDEEKDETVEDEAAETDEEQADEEAAGTELHSPDDLATAAEAAAQELAGYVSKVESIIEKAGEDHPMTQALEAMLKAAQDASEEADSASAESRKAADGEDIGGAATGAAKAAEACERIRKQLSIFEGLDDAKDVEPPPPRDKAVPGETDKAADKSAPPSPMGAWMNHYAK